MEIIALTNEVSENLPYSSFCSYNNSVFNKPLTWKGKIFSRNYIIFILASRKYAVPKCPATRNGLKWTKCSMVRNVHKNFMKGSLKLLWSLRSRVLEMSSNSKNYSGFLNGQMF